MKRTLIVSLLIVVIGISVGCKAKQASHNPAPQTASQSEGVTVQNSTGKCSPNIAGASGDIKVNCPKDQTGKPNVIKGNGDSTVIQTTTGDDSPNISGVNGNVTIVVDDGIKSPKKKTYLVCADGSKPTDGSCANGAVPQELHPTNHKH
jgi:hypothetical protein